MLFNSFPFILFFPIICAVYWLLDYVLPRRLKLAGCNLLLLGGSYYFYMCWQPKYALLLLLSTVVTYSAAIFLSKSETKRGKKAWMVAAIVVNLAILFFYKYYGFAAECVTSLMKAAGISMAIPGLDVLLPVGISFYTFQALGYLIDVYRGTTQPEKNFFTYALFVSFFPQLVAGPIERSTNLLRQFKERHSFDYDFAMSGFRLMLWGYFLKLCMADRAAMYSDIVFNNIHSHEGYSTLIAIVMFYLQLYGDFAGYSFIAIGCARILGFSLCENFRRPYFAVSVTDFWKRWHLSLSTWFRDYVYFPLGGSRGGKYKTYRNLMVTLGLSGLWHGANWTYVVWGLSQGMLMSVERAIGWHKRVWHSWQRLIHIFIALMLVLLSLVIFRANSLTDAIVAFRQIFSISDFTLTHGELILLLTGFVLLIVLAKECREEFFSEKMSVLRNKVIVNYLWPAFLMICIGWMGVSGSRQFVYFQF